MRRDWGPWTPVGDVLLIAVAAIARGALRGLRNRA